MREGERREERWTSEVRESEKQGGVRMELRNVCICKTLKERVTGRDEGES